MEVYDRWHGEGLTLTLYREGVGPTEAGRAEGLPPAGRRRSPGTPRPTHFYDEVFYRACRRFSFLFFMFISRDHKLRLKEGNSRTITATRARVRSSKISAFDFVFYGFSYVDVGLQRCHDYCIALDQNEGSPLPFHY